VATHQDLLDAINRVRASTGDRDAWQSGLSGEDIASACNPLSSPAALGTVLTKIVASHPDAFTSAGGPAAPPPRANEGAAAEAIREAETALAHQKSTAAQVDLQVVTAVLNAHSANAAGAAALDRLQREIEAAVQSRTDLDTPAGAREFQRFLIGKLREIRTVVDTAGLDATSKAALAAALASLYASATPEPAPPAATGEGRESESQKPLPVSTPRGPGDERPRPDEPTASKGPRESEPAFPPGFGDLPDMNASPWDAGASPWDIGSLPPQPTPAAAMPMPPATAPAMAAPAMAPPAMTAPAMAPAPAWGGTAPSGGGGLPPLPDLGRLEMSRDFDFGPGPDEPPPDRDTDPSPRAEPDVDAESDVDPDGAAVEDVGPDEPPVPADPHAVELPNGQTVSAPSPQIAAAVAAAVAGTPIPDAFRQQGIVLPPPGSSVAAPVDAAMLTPGDIAVLTDRHALALGNGTALLDNQIQPIANVAGPGFLGWQHPPGPAITHPQPPAVPAPIGPAETAPS
jgi:hypothetical protein